MTSSSSGLPVPMSISAKPLRGCSPSGTHRRSASGYRHSCWTTRPYIRLGCTHCGRWSEPVRCTEFHSRLLNHADSAYRTWGVRAAGNQHRVSYVIRRTVAERAHDPAPDVQLQVAIAARKIDDLDPLPVLIEVLSCCGQDRLIPSIVWPNLHPLLPEGGDRFTRLIERLDPTTAPATLQATAARGRPHPGRARRRSEACQNDHRATGTPGRRASSECLSTVSERTREGPEAYRRGLQTQLRPIVVTEDGRYLTGPRDRGRSRATIVLVLPGGAHEAVARNNVKLTRVSKLSMMPEGIETLLDRKRTCRLVCVSVAGPPAGRSSESADPWCEGAVARDRKTGMGRSAMAWPPAVPVWWP